MKRSKSIVKMLLAPMAVILLMGLGGCAADYGDGYGDGGPGWDGQLIVVGGYDGGYYGGHDRDHHAQAFHADGGRPAAQGSARGRASMGGRASGGGHASSGGNRK